MPLDDEIKTVLTRIAAALDRLSPRAPVKTDFSLADAFIWNPAAKTFDAVPKVNRQPLELLYGIDQQRDQLQQNTERFAAGLPANNALLWGARGAGKSSLVKAIHAHVATNQPSTAALKLVEIHRDDIDTLPACLTELTDTPHRFILFCDDLSFDADDTSYKSLKAVLEGGIEGKPDNVIFYATSNRRHLLPRAMMDNERSSAINPSDAVNEQVSLSDRFGLWLGFHNCSKADYLAIVDRYAGHYALDIHGADLHAQALQWANGRGSRSGRVAWQFIQDVAGRLGKRLD